MKRKDINEMNEKKLGLFLDDERAPRDVTWINYPDNINWFIIRNFEEFQDEIEDTFEFNLEKYDYISFDNDLQNKKEGKDAAKFLIDIYGNYDLELPVCFIHSKNPEAASYIESLLKSYEKHYWRNKQPKNC